MVADHCEDPLCACRVKIGGAPWYPPADDEHRTLCKAHDCHQLLRLDSDGAWQHMEALRASGGLWRPLIEADADHSPDPVTTSTGHGRWPR